MMAAVNGDDRFKDEVMRLVGGLRASKVQELFDVIDNSVDRDKKKSRVIRQALIDHLNHSRPHRARRLFTSLFEPLLITDPVLLRSPKCVPGAIQRLDAGCLWSALARHAFGDLADDVQRRLDDMAKDMLLEQVLSSETANHLLDILRDRAVAFIDQLRTNEVTLNRFLNMLNRLRNQDIQEKYPNILQVHELERNFIDFVYDAMVLGRQGRYLFTKALPTLGEDGKSGADLHRRAGALASYVEELRRTHPQAARRETCLHILPLAVINVRRAYQVAAGFAQARGQGDMGVQIGLALMAHFAACINEITAIFANVLAQGTRMATPPILLSTVERAELDAALPRLGEAAQSVRRCGILANNPRHDKTFASQWLGLSRIMIENVAEAVTARLGDAVAARVTVSVDHEDVMWLINFILRWRETARLCEQEPLFYTQWRTQVEEIFQNGVNAALRFDEYEDLGERLDHLMRIDQLCHLYGLTVSKFISLTSHNVCLVVLHRLQRQDPIPENERRFLRDFVTRIDRELKSSPSWRVPLHLDIQRVAETVDLV